MEGHATPARANRRLKIAGVAAFLAGILLGFGLVIYAGLGAIGDALASLGVSGLLIAALAHVAVVVCLGTAWWAIGRGQLRLHYWGFVWARAVREAAADALPFSQIGGYAIGARALVLAGADAAFAGVTTLLDFTLEFAGKIPYMLLGLVLLELMQPGRPGVLSGFAVLAFAAAAILLFLPRIKAFFRLLAERAFARWQNLARWRERIAEASRQTTSRRGNLWAGGILHFACWMMGAGETWLIFLLMAHPVTASQAIVIDSLVGAIRAALFFVPGSAGVQEAAYVLLCGLFGLPPGTAIAFSLVRRARDLLIAAPVFLSWHWRETRLLFPRWARPEKPGD